MVVSWFYGFWLVSMVFHGSRLACHGFRLVFHGFSPECTCPKLYPGPTIQSRLDKAPRLSISIVIWILSSDTETSAATPVGGGARKVLAK